GDQLSDGHAYGGRRRAAFHDNIADELQHRIQRSVSPRRQGHPWRPASGIQRQIGHVVLGLEGDWSWTNQKDSVTYSAMPVVAQFPPLPNFFFVPLTSQGWTSEQKLDWLTTLRGRLGWAQGANLWYVTGGVAWARIESNYTLVSSPGNTGLLAAS